MTRCASLFERPTLPSLHTLDLPVPLTKNRQFVNEIYDSYEPPQSCPAPNRWPYARQVSTSSSTSSRTPSPTPSIYPPHPRAVPNPHSSFCPPTTALFPAKFRLVPSPLDVADAVVVVPPPDAPFIPSLSCTSPIESARQGQALLLLGPALQHFRHPQRQIAKGARIHPYRIIRGGDSIRKPSSSFPPSV